MFVSRRMWKGAIVLRCINEESKYEIKKRSKAIPGLF